jgi:PRC-barrel domain
MPTVERIETWRGQDVLDGAGEKAGRLEEVYYDSTAQEPVLLSVKHGRLGRQVTLVPAAEAVLSHVYIRVPYSVEQIHHAESASAEDELSSEQVAAVGVLFNLTLPSSGPLYSASLIERRRVEAEKAERRAHELELEAQKRSEELEQARRRAGDAVEEAQMAKREREKAEAATIEASRESPQQP